jgi:hydrocephalus-inducing protein
MWPDPDKEPLPAPVINSIIKKPPNRSERAKITKFTIRTPADPEKPDDYSNFTGNNRWVLQPKESKTLFMMFYSTKIGTFTENLQFEIVGSYKTFTLPVTGICEFPTINTSSRNLYLNSKKARPAEKENILSKCFITSEGLFDFGPLLIKKDPETKNDETVAKFNGTFFQISNNGKYPLDAVFTLRSTLSHEEGGPEGKSPFILEPTECHLAVDGKEATLNLKVFAFPSEAMEYNDELIVLIKDNPNPVVIPIQCLGAKPVVTSSNDILKFERQLIGKTLTKTLTLTNASPLPVNWRLKNVEKLSHEFTVAKTSGLLKPYKEEGVDITFSSIK